MTLTLDRPLDLAPGIVDDATRRQFIAGGLAAGALLVTGCGESGSSAQAPAGSTDDDFPVTITHKYGTTTIPEKPERVITVGATDIDYVLALGVQPVGTVTNLGESPNGIAPWAQDEAGDAKPVLVNDSLFGELNFEQIAGLRPNLIIGIYYTMTEDDYEILSKIAPTVGPSHEFSSAYPPWQDYLRITAQALGLSDRAKEIESDLDARFADARTAHPELAGKTIVIPFIGPTYLGVYTSLNEQVRRLETLGLKVPEAIASLGPEAAGKLSNEQFRLLEADIAYFLQRGGGTNAAGTVATDPLFSKLPVVTEGRAVFSGRSLMHAAFNTNSPLSLPYVLDELTPRLAAAADEDPNTEVEPDDTPTY